MSKTISSSERNKLKQLHKYPFISNRLVEIRKRQSHEPPGPLCPAGGRIDQDSPAEKAL